eukprot:PITA_24198
MLGRVIFPKYQNLGSLVVDVHIDGIISPHTLIDLGIVVNVMTKETNLKLKLQRSLRNTTTVLQLEDRSIVALEGVVEDVVVSIDSWEYHVDFLVLHTKTKFNDYPLILGRPWLATTDTYISCRVGNMTIKMGICPNSWDMDKEDFLDTQFLALGDTPTSSAEGEEAKAEYEEYEEEKEEEEVEEEEEEEAEKT